MSEKTAQTEISDLQDAIDILYALKTHGAIALMQEKQNDLFGGENDVDHH